jgi:hypothetical protein
LYGLLTIVVAACLGRANGECNVFRTTYVGRTFPGALGAGVGLGGVEDNFRVEEAIVLTYCTLSRLVRRSLAPVRADLSSYTKVGDYV